MKAKLYLTKFLDDFSFLEEAKKSLLSDYDKLIDLGKSGVIHELVELYRNNSIGYDDGIKTIGDLAQETGIHEYSLVMLYLIFLSDVLKERYKNSGIDESVWFDTISDLKFKTLDCHGLYGVWGTKDADWHKHFFAMTQFGFGKLQFAHGKFGTQYEKNGIKLQEDSHVLWVHIPRTGGKLDYESVQNAYKKGIAFFRKHFPEYYADNPVVFVCRSWMLYEKHKQILNPESNFMRFINDFDIFATGY